MARIVKYSLKLVKESAKNYDIDNIIRNPYNATEIINTVLDLNNEHVEKFGILALDTKNKVIGVHIISIGSLNSSLVHPREVFKSAILNNAASIILFHNHPSGDCTPSSEDIGITKRLRDAGELMGVPVLDHIIVGDRNYRSLKEMDVF